MNPLIGTLSTVLWVIFLVYWLISSFTAKKMVRGSGWAAGILMRLVTIVAIVVTLSFSSSKEFLTHPLSNSALGWFGVALNALGIGLAIWARIYIGRNWGMPMSQKIHTELVTSGPYASIRHPIYAGALIAILGSGFILPIWWIFFVFFAIYFIYSATVEEKRMMSLFPDVYPAYKKRTNMLIPGIF